MIRSIVKKSEWVRFLPDSGFDNSFKIRNPLPTKYSTYYTEYRHNGFKFLNNENYLDLDFASSRFEFESNSDIYFDVGSGGKVLVSNLLKFDDVVTTKIEFYSHSYAVEVAANTLKIRSDWYLWLGSDTNQDAVIIDGNTGDVTIEGTLTANNLVNSSGTSIQAIDRSSGYAINDTVTVNAFVLNSTRLYVDRRVYIRGVDYEEQDTTTIKFLVEIEPSSEYPIYLEYV